MTKEELLSFKKELKKLSETEIYERNEYLRKISLGEIEGPMTGYPSIDMPSLKYYDMEKYYNIKVKENFADSLFKQNKDNLDGIALEYFFTKITYKKYFDESIKLIKALRSYNIENGDYVSLCLAGIPEAMYSVYALAYLGAAGIYLPPYLKKETLINDINKDKSRIIIIMDVFYEKIKDLVDEVLKETSVEKVVVVPTLNSSILGKFKKEEKFDNKKIITYNEFIKNGEKEYLPPMAKYEEKKPLAVVYSSGTTGDLKGVLLSHDTFNNSARSYLAFGFNLSKGQKVYQAIPVWSSTGLIADGTSALYYGCTLHQNPQFDPIVYSKNLGLYRNNWGIATTELFNGLVTLKDQKKFKVMLKLGILDYSQLENVYIGGTFSSPKDRERLNGVLKNLGSNAKVRGSWGTCENGSIVSAELNGIDHPDYSVGIPIPGVTVIAIDENYNELPYYQRGELIVKTDCGMLEYYNRPELNNVFITEREELSGFKHTGDIGYIMPTGDVIYEGRANDISVIDDKTIYNFDVKKALLADSDIFDCEVFMHNFDNELCANIVFVENSDINVKEKLEEIQKNLYEYFQDITYVPKLFKIRDSFPMASSTKRDFKKLKEENEGYIYLDNSYLNNKGRVLNK